MYRVLDLFSGIGGFSLGLERTGGFKTVAFCEIEPFCRKVLNKLWPHVPVYEDVRTVTAERLRADGIGVDVITGGFPCQDISLAGKGAGIEGERSGLWTEYARLIGELRPHYVIVENVAALLGRGLDRVLGDLSEIGFDAEWHCIPASAVGAPHRRDRLWLVAHAGRQHGERWPDVRSWHCDTDGQGSENREEAQRTVECGSQDVADATGERRRKAGGFRSDQQTEWPSGRCEALGHAYLSGLEVLLNGNAGELASAVGASAWRTEPDVGRVAYGVPSRVDRLRALGNAVVPQIPELIGRAILASEQERAA